MLSDLGRGFQLGSEPHGFELVLSKKKKEKINCDTSVTPYSVTNFCVILYSDIFLCLKLLLPVSQIHIC